MSVRTCAQARQKVEQGRAHNVVLPDPDLAEREQPVWQGRPRRARFVRGGL